MAKIPEGAKRVYEGVIYDTYHWEQEMFDGSFETFEMLKRANTVEIIATVGDKIVISRDEQPVKGKKIGLIGGRMDQGETPLESAKRELLEESGLASENWELYRSYMPITKIEWEVFIFVARDCKKVAEQNLDPGERIELIELSYKEFENKLLYEDFYSQELAWDLMKRKTKGESLEEFKEFIFKK